VRVSDCASGSFLTILRGCRRSEDPAVVLEELLWEDWCAYMGCWCYGSVTGWWLQRGTCGTTSGRGKCSLLVVLKWPTDWRRHNEEVDGCQFACVCKQDWRGRMHVSGGDTGGMWGLKNSVTSWPQTDNSSHAQGLQLDAIKTHKWAIISCSAITGENLKEGLEWVVQDAKERLFLY
jgi:hypothetical protein